jgi:enterochelin esterase-like enzyme
MTTSFFRIFSRPTHFACLGWLLAQLAFAAVPASRPYTSPEIHPDRTVTFRILAPKAAEVTLEGGWQAPNQPVPMVKDDKGLWSVTVGPLKPTVYSYWFNLDGAVVLDEANPYVRIRGVKSSLNNVDIPAAEPLPWSIRDVPHGVVEQHLVKSATFDETRSLWVYLPPGYEKNTARKYPVLYLFHGAGELYRSWTESGKANLIFDNFIADGKMKPMIVVMPLTGPAENAPPQPPPSVAGASAGPPPAGQSKAADYIVSEVMPWTEAHYRLLPGRKNRAIAGLSAGGALAGAVGLAHLDRFSQIGMFSAPLFNAQAVLADVAKDPKATNGKLDVFWIGVGKSDPGIEPALVKFDAELTADGIRHSFTETEGAHDYSVWRWCLTQFVPLLFQQHA